MRALAVAFLMAGCVPEQQAALVKFATFRKEGDEWVLGRCLPRPLTSAGAVRQQCGAPAFTVAFEIAKSRSFCFIYQNFSQPMANWAPLVAACFAAPPDSRPFGCSLDDLTPECGHIQHPAVLLDVFNLAVAPTALTPQVEDQGLILTTPRPAKVEIESF